MIEKVDISKLKGNLSASYSEPEEIPYSDIELLAVKLNEIIDLLTALEKRN